MPGLFAELYRSSLCHMVKKLQVFMSGANLGTHTLVSSTLKKVGLECSTTKSEL